jgi:hypothetical protein
MRTWRHSHNLRQKSTRERLDGVVSELKAERDKLEAERSAEAKRSSDDESALKRIDQALSLLEQALLTLAT